MHDDAQIKRTTKSKLGIFLGRYSLLLQNLSQMLGKEVKLIETT
jgi:hypothetical protein